MVDDAALLSRYAATRAEEPFAELVRRHVGGVYSAALRRVGGDLHLAEDVTQQVFVALARKAPALATHPFLTSWLYVTTRNEAANVVRRERRRKAREQEAQAMHEMLNASSTADWSRVAPVLDAAMDELNEKDRTAVLLRFVDRHTFAEIGAAFRLKEDAARMRVDRALEKLRVQLARRGITSTCGALGIALANHAVVAAPSGLASGLTGAAVAAAGAGGAGAIFAPFVLMTTTHKTAAVAAFLALLAAGGALHQHRAASQATVERLAMERQLASLRLDLQASADRLAASQQETERNKNLGTSPSPAATGPDKRALIAQLEAEQMRLFLATEWAKLTRGALPLIEKLGASAEQVARYTELADRELDGTYPTGPDAIGRHLAAVQGKWRTETREIIGDEQFERLKALQIAQGTVAGFANYLHHWDQPLNDRQGSQMLDLVATNHQAAFRGGEGILPDAVLAQARQILSPAQMESWSRFFGLKEAQRRLTEQAKSPVSCAAPMAKPSH